ncbi:hypothetical protein G6F56_013120 [Rhizopus delemar]|nr:hypothetical protein G6F56_013120 [Rhizopus delemar]
MPVAWIDLPLGRQHGLHRTLAEGAAADHAGALVVAQRAGQHFRGTGRTGIGQHHHRCALQQVAGGRVEPCVADADAAAGADDVALVEQIIGHLHRGGQQAARVAAQVQHQAVGIGQQAARCHQFWPGQVERIEGLRRR